MQLRDVLDFFTQFMVMMTCIKILGFGKLYTCFVVAVYVAIILMTVLIESEQDE